MSKFNVLGLSIEEIDYLRRKGFLVINCGYNEYIIGCLTREDIDLLTILESFSVEYYVLSY